MTGVGLVVLPISARFACALSLGKSVKQKENKKNTIGTKRYQKGQETIESFDKRFRKNLQIILKFKVNMNFCVIKITNLWLKKTINLLYQSKQFTLRK